MILTRILLCLLVTTKCCFTQRGNECSTCRTQSKCIDTIPATSVNQTLGIESKHLCYQSNTCFGVNETSKVPVQQYPLQIFKGQQIIFNVGTLLQSSFTFKILSSASYNHFTSCNISQARQISYSQQTDSLISLEAFEPGIYYLLFSSSHVLYSCVFGYRIQVVVYDHTCFIGNGSMCSSHGKCLLNQTARTYQCNCCPGYYGTYCEKFNSCSTNPCLNNGTCVDVINSTSLAITCSCHPQFTGDFCQSCISGFIGERCNKDINECNVTQQICNYGVCNNTYGGFHCHCPVNVTGRLCDVDLYDNCQSNPCSRNATCVDEYGSFRCVCQAGFTGQNCDVNINECVNNTCAVEGTAQCVDLIGQYMCQCIPGYTGTYCETDINECNSDPCRNGGLCLNQINKYTCACQPGYDGTNCQNIANKCKVLKPCENNGTCNRSGHNLRNYTCQCTPGWTGRNCSTEINECLSTPCLNNATCHDLFNAFKCDCLLGWTGSLCESNIDMCISAPCQNNASCIDSLNGLDYSCECLAGFTSKNCSVNIDDCVFSNASCINGQCVDLVNGYICQCQQGWYGKNCDTDKDLCSQNPCVNSLHCENVNSTLGYQCFCKPGFTGQNCFDRIDNCINNTCQNGATCHSVTDFYNCTCAPGFEGQFCQHEKNECISNPCQNNGTCKDFINQYFCNCKPGFSGLNCEVNIDECLSLPCQNNGTCIDEVNDFACNCLHGFTTKDCSLHVCNVSNTCKNNATCIQTLDGFHCLCSQYFTGSKCENSINECLSTPCKNNGSCIDLYNGYRCTCGFPFSGRHCEKHLCDCNICQNGATCIPSQDNYECQCVPGFTGRTCENDINECRSHLCNVNGTLRCTDLVNNYVCVCNYGYTGRFCQTHLCDLGNICGNGSCLKTKNGYNCSCNAGFSGSNCENDINECLNVSCGEGTCIDTVNNYTCLCPTLRSGRNCEINLDFCSSSPCLHNSTCTNVLSNGSYTCTCQHPFVGSHCRDHVCNVSHPCNNGTCNISHNNFTCNCFPGFTGKFCNENIDNCLDNPCFNGGVCLNAVNNFTCKCPTNSTGSRCESILNFCNSSVCLNNGSCISNYTERSYECTCQPAFTGSECQFHECDIANPCKNNATCLRSPLAVKCECRPGFTSDDCSIEINECESFPCLNNGTCTDLVNGYNCQCLRNFTGDNCEIFLNYCNSSSCLNGGTCHADHTKKTFSCVCSPNHTGKRCEVSLMGPCKTQPCGVNGVCSEISSNSYNCTCLFGFYGRHCENFNCPCVGGRCLRYYSSEQYRCVCKTGFTGRYCETFNGDCRNTTDSSLKCVDSSFCQKTDYGFACICPPHLQGKQCETAGGCRNTTCKNGANCIGDEDYKCNCAAGFTGKYCEFDINECLSFLCFNNGSCAEDGLQSSRCYCPAGLMGANCQYKMNTSTTLSTLLSKASTGMSTIYSSSTFKTVKFNSDSNTVITPTRYSKQYSSTPFSSHLIRSNVLSQVTSKLAYTTVKNLTISLSATKFYYSTLTTYPDSISISTKYRLDTVSIVSKKLFATSSKTASLFKKSHFTSLSTGASTVQVTEYVSTALSTEKNFSVEKTITVSSNSITKSFKTVSSSPIRSTGNLSSRFVMSNFSSQFSNTKNTSNLFSLQPSSTVVSSAAMPVKSSFASTPPIISTTLIFNSTSLITSTKVNIHSTLNTQESFKPNTRLTTSQSPRATANYFSNISTKSNFITSTFPHTTPVLLSTNHQIVSSNTNRISETRLSSVAYVSSSRNYPTTIVYNSTTTTTPAPTALPTVVTTTQRPFLNLTCSDQPCNGFLCVNETDNGLPFRCICPFPAVGPRCVLGSTLHFARFNGHSFIELPKINLNQSLNTISMSFNTVSEDGLLLYMNHSQHNDFIMISVVEGFLKYQLSTGDESITLKTATKVNTGRSVFLTASYDSLTGVGTLSLIGKEQTSKTLQSSLRDIDITSNWHVGGIRTGILSVKNFTGCIRDFQVNSKPFSLTDASQIIDWLSVSECEISACERGACHNNATCIQDIYDLNSFVCRCQPGYFGDDCRQVTDHCAGDPCNGGLCVWTANGRQCLCQYGRLGSTCLIDTIISVPQYSVFQNYSSYTEYPWLLTGKFAYERFEIRLQFKVSGDVLQDGLMVYLGQNEIGSVGDDFFAVGIINNHIALIFNLGNGHTILKSKEPIQLKRKWHFIVAGRTRQHGYLYVNSLEKVTGVTPGLLTGLDIYTSLYIGGVPNYNRLPPSLYAYFRTGFTGTIYDVSIRTGNSSFAPLLTLTEDQAAISVIGVPVVGGLNVNNDGENQCVLKPCANNGTCISTGTSFTCRCQPPYKGNLCHDKELSCIDYNPCHPGSTCRADGFDIQCDCQLGWKGAFCSEEVNISTPYFKEKSFLALPSVRVRSTLKISLEFKTDTKNGLLFYVSRNLQSSKGDFLAVSLWKGYIYVRFNLGHFIASMRTHKKITVGRWHSFYFYRVRKDAIMKLDNNRYIGVRSRGSMNMLDVGSQFYLGGVPYLSSLNMAAVKSVQAQSDFTGCVKYLKVNNKIYPLHTPSTSNMIGRNIEDCGSSCAMHHCQNKASCVPTNATVYECKCALGNVGSSCEQVAPSFTAASFTSTSYWFTRFAVLSSSSTGHYDLLFKTNRDGLIFWHGKLREAKSDYLVAGIVNGNVHLSVSMDGQTSSAVIGQSAFSDNRFHRLRINRVKNIFQFIVNGHTPKIVMVNTAKSSFNNDGYFYLGGLPGAVKELSMGKYNTGFEGCIANVTVTGNKGYVNFGSTNNARGLGIKPCL